MNLDTDRPDVAPWPPNVEGHSDATVLFHSIVADADEGVLVLGPDGLVAYANAASEFLLGHGREELAGEMFGLARATPDRATTVNVISRDGCVRIVELRVEPLPTGPGGSLVLRLKDVTAYHQDVVNAREQVRRRDEFLAMLSHEIRNPFSAIRSAALLLARDDVTDEIRHATGEILDRQFRHLGRILDDLLDITRIAKGKLEIVKERADLIPIVRDAIDEAAPLIARREHRLRLDLPRREVWVEGDATRLGQVVVNLVNNAAKFTPPRGNISVALAIEGTEVEICVRDDGPGIPADLWPHIFEPFVQGRQTLARSEGGLGLGLSLVYNIVLLHGGSVWAEPNTDGPGVAFKVKLPLSRPGEERLSDRKEEPIRPLRILLVEDRDDARRLLRRILQLEGHEVIEATDGPGGLAALLEQQPDVALLDIGLPGLDGYELARQARQDERGRHVRMIALTGYGQPHDVQQARCAGFDGHLVKPVHYPDLEKLLRDGGNGCPEGAG
jgi:signal transduction histidine kinase/CheY-like chemotaxis protein